MQNWPPNVMEAIMDQVAAHGRTGSTQIMCVPDLPAPIQALGTMQATPLQFREPGVVIAMYGQELRGTAPAFASTRVRVQIGGQVDLFSNGNVGTFRSMLGLFGGAQNWYSLWRRAEPGVNWVVYYENLDAGNTATPEVSFGFLSDAAIAKFAG